MKIQKFNERIDWKGQWIPDKESPFDKVSEYTLKQQLIKEVEVVTKKYQGKIKDKTIVEALSIVTKKYII